MEVTAHFHFVCQQSVDMLSLVVQGGASAVVENVSDSEISGPTTHSKCVSSS